MEGVSVPAWSGRAASRALDQVRAGGRARRTPCVICRQPIDYSLRYPHPQSCSVQHLKSRRDFPQLTWEPSNWAPAHLDCNKAEGPRERPGLGVVGQW
ncbi:HNH endonuclease [Zhihengliuella halotolerans]|uniref:APC 15 residue motif-containing protein n=1 Tax=Zhihengliuella halotolerans TaxID=370736 RepID=A0A4Q8ADL6_9MICC|nr:HNH endonuclease [Zhihengliuella halotolerans]RZU61755.1 APC 15 residue motif-containing protein [Zhihengliuella halotolerans]